MHRQEPFVTLTQLLLEFYKTGDMPIILQRRQDFTNYGEVVGRMNAADNDRWDVFAPGLSQMLPTGSIYSVERVVGVVVLPNGNHKVIVVLQGHAPNPVKLHTDMEHFIKRYRNVYNQAAVFYPLLPVQ